MHPDEFQLYERAIAGRGQRPADDHGRPGAGGVRLHDPHARAWCRVGHGAAFVAQAQDFLDAIGSGRGVETDFWSGYRTMLVCDAAQQAATEGRPVAIETAVA